MKQYADGPELTGSAPVSTEIPNIFDVVSGEQNGLTPLERERRELEGSAEDYRHLINQQLRSRGLTKAQRHAWWERSNEVVDYQPPRDVWPLAAKRLLGSLGIQTASDEQPSRSDITY